MPNQIILKYGTSDPSGLILLAEPAVDVSTKILYVGTDASGAVMSISNDELQVLAADTGDGLVWNPETGLLDVSVATVTSLEALTDVSVVEVSIGDVLAYSEAGWTNTGISTGELIDVQDGSLLDIQDAVLVDIDASLAAKVDSVVYVGNSYFKILNNETDGASIRYYDDMGPEEIRWSFTGGGNAGIIIDSSNNGKVLEMFAGSAIQAYQRIQYNEDKSGSYDERTLIDKGYADGAYLQKSSSDGLTVVDGSIVFGDYANGNYLEIYSDGTIRAHGAATGYDDLFVPLVQGKQGSTSLPNFDYDEVAYMFPQNDPDEILYFQVQLPHRWKEGSRLYPHVHYRQADASTAPTYKLDYKIASIGGSFNNAWQTYTMDTSVAAWIDSSTHQLNRGDGGVDASTYTKSAIILCKLYRDDNTVTGDVPTYQFDIHFEVDGLGSETEFTKI